MVLYQKSTYAAFFTLMGALAAPTFAQNLPATAPQKQSNTEWRNVEINGGGFVSGLVFHPKERGLLLARTDIGGAYRWNPVSNRWMPLTDHFGSGDWNLLGIESIALDPSNPNRVYLAAGTYTNDWAGNGAILRSSDRGNTWARADLPFKNGGNEDGRGMGERLVVHPRASKTLFFGTRRNGLWKSGDAGASWQKIAAFPAPDNENGIGISFLTFDSKNTLFAGVASKTSNLFQSSDGGASWKAVSGAPQGNFPHHGVFAADGTLYLTYSNDPGPNGITGGAVWKRSAAGVWTKITPDAGSGFGYAGLGVDARNPRVLMVSTIDRWAQGDDIFRSVDGGQSWASVKAKSTRDSSAAPYLNWGKAQADLGHWIGDLEIDPFDSSHVLYTTGATIWGSDNANALDRNELTQWSVRAAGIEEVSVSKLLSPPVGPHLISGMRDIGGFVHDDLTVSPRAGIMDNPRLLRNEGIDYAGQKPNLIVRSGDGNGGFSLDSGQNWTPFAAKPDAKMDQGAIVVSADGAALVWSNGGAATYFSKDQGTSWTRSAGLPAKTSLVADRVTPGVFYALDGAAGRLLVSDDNGATFSPRGAALPGSFSKIAAAPSRAGEVWILGASGLSHSKGGGTNWAKTPGVVAADALGFGKAAPGANSEALYLVGKAGEVYGVFRSDDAGLSWTRINDDSHQWGYIGQSISGDPRVFGRVFIATNGRGILWGEPMSPILK